MADKVRGIPFSVTSDQSRIELHCGGKIFRFSERYSPQTPIIIHRIHHRMEARLERHAYTENEPVDECAAKLRHSLSICCLRFCPLSDHLLHSQYLLRSVLTHSLTLLISSSSRNSSRLIASSAKCSHSPCRHWDQPMDLSQSTR